MSDSPTVVIVEPEVTEEPEVTNIVVEVAPPDPILDLVERVTRLEAECANHATYEYVDARIGTTNEAIVEVAQVASDAETLAIVTGEAVIEMAEAEEVEEEEEPPPVHHDEPPKSKRNRWFG